MSGAPSGSAWRLLAVLFGAALLSYTDRQILNVLAEPIKDELGFSDVQVGLLQGFAFAGVYAVASMPVGRLADRISRRLLLLSGIGLWSAAMVGASLASSFETLFLSRLVVGAGEAALAPAAISLLSDAFPPDRRGPAISIYLLGQILGGGASVVIGGTLLELFGHLTAHLPLSPWRSVLLVLGTAGLLPLIALAVIDEPVRGGLEPSTDEGSLDFLPYLRDHARLLFPVYAAMALISFGEYGALSWTPALLIRVFHWQPGDVAKSMGSVALFGPVAGTIGGIALAQGLGAYGRARAKLLVALGGVLLGVPGCLLGLQSSGAFVVALLAFWVIGPTASLALILSVIPDVMPASIRGRGAALSTFLNTLLGLGCAPVFVGAIADGRIGAWRDLGIGITLCTSVGATAAVLFLIAALRVLPPAFSDPTSVLPAPSRPSISPAAKELKP